MKIPKCLILSLLFAKFGFSQSCDCNSNLLAVISGIEKNYAGYFDKVNENYLNEYNKIKKKLINRSHNSPINYKCIQLISSYLSYFNDPHISLRRITASEEDKAFWKQIFKTNENSDTNLIKLEIQNSSDPMEGFWINESGNLEVAIVKKEKKFYSGIILKGDMVTWFPGQEKFEINARKKSAIFFSSLHIPKKQKVGIFENELTFGKWGRFIKQFQNSEIRADSLSFYLVKKNDSVTYIRLPSFHLEYLAKIDSLIANNISVLDSSKFVIVDLTDNTGGSVLCFQKLIPYVVGEDYIQYGSKLRASLENSKYYLDQSKDTMLPEFARNWYKNNSLVMKDSLDHKFIKSSDNIVIKSDFEIKKTKKIIFLINGRTASAAESLLSIASQNKNCILAGQETAGLIDYVNNNSDYLLPCPFMRLIYPTLRSNIVDIPGHLPNQGFKPDVILNFNTEKWVDYAIQKIILKK